MAKAIVIPDGTKHIIPARTKIDENSERVYEHELIFDYSGVTSTELMGGHSRQARIDWQRKFRKHPENYPEGGVNFKVKDMLKGVRTEVQLTKEGVAARASGDAAFRDEVIAELLAQREADAK
jgi:hypothetical protein